MPPLQRLRAILALATVAAAAGLALPGPALASCRNVPSLHDDVRTADIVFVGTVRATANADRTARVAIEEIWRGPLQFGEVIVRGGPEGGLGTSVDRQFVVGERYIFFPYLDETGALADNACSSTQPTTDDTWNLRPANALTLEKSYGDDLVTFDVIAVVIGGLLLVMLAVVVVTVQLVRRRSD